MRDEPRRAWTRPPRVVARAGRLAWNVIATSLATARKISTRPLANLALANPALANPSLANPAPATSRLVTMDPATTRPLTTGQATTSLVTTGLASHRPLATRLATRRALTAGLATAGLVITGGLLATGCGAGTPAAFRPAGASAGTSAGAGAGTGTGTGTAGRTGNLASPAHRAAGPLHWPPFGGNVHIVMPGWLPADPGQVPAVIAAKDFLLAFLYAEYRGNQDDRWTGYASGPVLSALKANLSEPSVTTESFTGTIIFSHMRAFPDPATAGAIDVSECFDNAGSRNTDLTTGKSIADRIPASQHYYMNTDVVAKANGQWRVISVYPVVYYPQAQECKP
jgi:hypothetical protein